MNERLKQVNHQFADPSEAPAEPNPAATVLLVRDIQGEGLEVFLIDKMHSDSLPEPAPISNILSFPI